MFIAEPFNACQSCPAPVSCNIRSACDLQPAIDLTAEIVMLKARLKLTQDELCKANGALIASRELCRQLNATIDRMTSVQAYATTKRFHQEQSRGVSIPAAELEVTEEEDEAFDVLAQRINELHKATQDALNEMGAQFNQSLMRIESIYMTQQGRINTAHDRLDALREAL